MIGIIPCKSDLKDNLPSLKKKDKRTKQFFEGEA